MKKYLIDTNILIYYFADTIPQKEVTMVEEIFKTSFGNATAIQTDPEILMMDEVLAVGDMEFQQKCLDVFQRYIKEKRTILFVSHDMNSVRRFCSKALLLRHGNN